MKKKTLKENLVRLMLCMAFCFVLCTKTVYADDEPWDTLITSLLSSPSETDYYKIEQDAGIIKITLKKDLEAPVGTYTPLRFSGTYNYTLNLNGHKIDAKNKGCVIEVDNSATLTINGPGTIVNGNNADGNGGGIYSEGNLILNNVTIKDCKAQNGGAIYNAGGYQIVHVLDVPDTYKIKPLNAKVLIIDNCDATNNGGGIYSKGYSFLTSTFFINCDASENGGAIYNATNGVSADQVEICSRLEMATGDPYALNISSCTAKKGSAIYNENDATCTISDGVRIKDNTASNNGTIYNEGVLGLNNCTITNNKAVSGGGIYLNNNGTLFLGGNANVTENMNESNNENNLHLVNGGRIIFGSGSDVSVPKTSMKVGLTLDAMGSNQEIRITENGNSTYANYLYSDDPNVSFTFDGTKFIFPATIIAKTSKKYKANYDKELITKITGTGKKGSKRTIYPLEGKEIKSLTVTDKDEEEIEYTKNDDGTFTFIQPKSDVYIDIEYINRVIKLTIGSTEASLNGEKASLDVFPVIRNDRTMLPIRFIAESLGALVNWDSKSPSLVTISKGSTSIEITLDSDVAKVNGKEVMLDSSAFSENNRTYMPVRFIAEALNCDVIWDEKSPSEVIIKEK